MARNQSFQNDSIFSPSSIILSDSFCRKFHPHFHIRYPISTFIIPANLIWDPIHSNLFLSIHPSFPSLESSSVSIHPSDHDSRFHLTFLSPDFHWNSFSTMVSVTSVAFILAVLLTALAFICCKRYWKERDDRNLEYHETTFYRMACSTSDAPLVTNPTLGGPYSFSSDGSGRVTNHSDLLNSYRVAAAAAASRTHVISSSTSATHLHQDMNGISVIELPGYPPPPYRSRTSINLDAEADHMNHMNHSNTLQVVTAGGDPSLNSGHDSTIRPTSAIVVRKPFWRKLSQWVNQRNVCSRWDDRDYRRCVGGHLACLQSNL